jgi:NADH-quinone oxidoreductase subunit C
MDIQAYKDKIVDLVKGHLGQEPENTEIQYDFVIIDLPKDKVYTTLAFLKENETTKFTFLTTMCGIHFSEEKDKEFALMYQLHNMHTNDRLRIRTFLPRIDMNMPTITPLFPTANWMEREAYDFYGFNFIGHPSLNRILNMDEMNYHPLRREYALEDGGRSDKEDKYFGR